MKDSEKINPFSIDGLTSILIKGFLFDLILSHMELSNKINELQKEQEKEQIKEGVKEND